MTAFLVTSLVLWSLLALITITNGSKGMKDHKDMIIYALVFAIEAGMVVWSAVLLFGGTS